MPAGARGARGARCRRYAGWCQPRRAGFPGRTGPQKGHKRSNTSFLSQRGRGDALEARSTRAGDTAAIARGTRGLAAAQAPILPEITRTPPSPRQLALLARAAPQKGRGSRRAKTHPAPLLGPALPKVWASPPRAAVPPLTVCVFERLQGVARPPTSPQALTGARRIAVCSTEPGEPFGGSRPHSTVAGAPGAFGGGEPFGSLAPRARMLEPSVALNGAPASEGCQGRWPQPPAVAATGAAGCAGARRRRNAAPKSLDRMQNVQLALTVVHIASSAVLSSAGGPAGGLGAQPGGLGAPAPQSGAVARPGSSGGCAHAVYGAAGAAGSATSTPTPLHALAALRDGPPSFTSSATSASSAMCLPPAGPCAPAPRRQQHQQHQLVLLPVLLPQQQHHHQQLDAETASPLSSSSRVALPGAATPCGGEAISVARVAGCKRTHPEVAAAQQQRALALLQQQQQQQVALAAAQIQQQQLLQQQQLGQHTPWEVLLASQKRAALSGQRQQPLLVSQSSGTSSATSSCGGAGSPRTAWQQLLAHQVALAAVPAGTVHAAQLASSGSITSSTSRGVFALPGHVHEQQPPAAKRAATQAAMALLGAPAAAAAAARAPAGLLAAGPHRGVADSAPSRLLAWAGQVLHCQQQDAYHLAAHMFRRVAGRLDDMLLISLGATMPADRVAMLVSLWVGSKLEGHRRQVASSSKLAAALQVLPWAVTSMELHVMQLLDWQPYAGWPSRPQEQNCVVCEH